MTVSFTRLPRWSLPGADSEKQKLPELLLDAYLAKAPLGAAAPHAPAEGEGGGRAPGTAHWLASLDLFSMRCAAPLASAV
mmetsp:Transcript_56947/g.114265  ORF Transcript_56947/g.114265 Transcript_56947/m.114265 type:complete len:80 (-) Transcript_56947:229-468(-)